jgi:hypothetical protein
MRRAGLDHRGLRICTSADGCQRNYLLPVSLGFCEARCGGEDLNDLMFPYPDRSLRLLTERCQEHRLKGVP